MESLKPVIDMLGLDFTDYVNQSVYEIETLKMRDNFSFDFEILIKNKLHNIFSFSINIFVINL